MRRGSFVALLACVLAARLLVPAGFMPVVAQGVVTLQPCPGVLPAGPMPGRQDMAGMAHHGEEPRVEMPCSFAGMGAAALGSAPPLLLAAAIAFVFLGVRRLAAQVLRAPPRLRPPLRAPPLSA
jgi:hypothetical protein